MDVKRYFAESDIPCMPWEALIDKYEADGFTVDFDFDLSYEDSEISVKKKQELRDTLNLRGEPRSYKASVYVKREFGDFEHVTFFSFWLYSDQHFVRLTSYDLKLINEGLDFLKSLFGLTYCREKDLPGTKLEKIAFVGHSFDAQGNTYFADISRFLDLLGFEVLSGQTFGAKRVSEKVKQRLDAARLILIIWSAKKDYTWLIQESSIRTDEKPLIILKEEEAAWNPGIHGDIEYIEFPQGEIQHAFIPLLEGLDEADFITSYQRKSRIVHRKVKERKIQILDTLYSVTS